MILVRVPLRSGTGLPTILAVFSAMRGMMTCTISNLDRVLVFLSFLLRWVLRLLPQAFNAREISSWMMGTEAMASLASEVKGILVEATWTSMIAGPKGMPEPPLCSSP